MKTTYKECSVVMIATEKAENCITKKDSTLRYESGYLTQYYMRETNREVYHLYITSTEEIREGDWFITKKGSVFQAIRTNNNDIYFYQNNDGFEYINQQERCSKIISTTDKHLTTEQVELEGVGGRLIKHNLLPQIPQSFIESYCKNPVDKVLVEYEHDDTVPYPKLRLKLDSNTISISTAKTSWSREEHSLNLQHCVSLFAAERGITPTSKEMKVVNDWTTNWIKENL